MPDSRIPGVSFANRSMNVFTPNVLEGSDACRMGRTIEFIQQSPNGSCPQSGPNRFVPSMGLATLRVNRQFA